MHGHHEIFVLVCADIPDPGPFGIPTMRPIIGIGGLGQAIKRPFAIVPASDDHRLVVPTG